MVVSMKRAVKLSGVFWRVDRFTVHKSGALHKNSMRYVCFVLCFFVLCFSVASDTESSAYNLFKLVYSEMNEFNGNVKFLTKKLFEPYVAFCLKVDRCDEALESVRYGYVRYLHRRLRRLDEVELILWKLKQKMETENGNKMEAIE